ncbi:MAG TPA: UTP--glucose-1-phosphate uridylyltransferase GalU [Mycobacteriales bacterium]|nr:UTP--glucose-1-phosphate uridylyltransferase GalU [Mycobacteriales bacterium]
MTSPVRKAVIPAAGLGTRFLPATKAIPKEMLPVVDKPAIQYVVEEAARAGLDDVLFITAEGKDAIEDHFARNPELEDALSGNEAKREMLARIQRISNLANVHSVLQDQPLGLGHAVLCAADHVGDEPFAVMLGDDLIDERDDLLAQMVDVQQRLGGCVVALLEVPHEQIGMYGCAAVEATDSEDVVRITGLVEKPPPDEAPSDLAIIGRYVLTPQIFDVLRTTAPGRGGEIQLTDGIEALIGRTSDGGPVHGVIFRGRRYDTGDRADYLKAVVRLGCDRADLGADFRRWLTDFVAGGSASVAPTETIQP